MRYRRHRRKRIININIDIDKEIIKQAIIEGMQKVKEEETFIKKRHKITELIKMPLVWALWGFALLLALISIACIVFIFDKTGTYNVPQKVAFGIIFIYSFLVAILLYNTGRELNKERDKHYVVALFSAFVSLAAMIIAIVK